MLAVIFATTTIHDILAERKITNDLPIVSETVADFNINSLKSEIAELNLHHIEGIWQFTATGAEVAICRRDKTGYGHSQEAISYNIILIHSPNRVLRPGTIMGIAIPTPKLGEYEARIYTRYVDSKLTLPKKFTLTLDEDDNALTFKQHRSALSINLWSTLPYLWRRVVKLNREEKSAAGCIRIFPQPTLPREPIYL